MKAFDKSDALTENSKSELFDYKQPLISVITVTLNSGKTLEQTIQSVLNQTYKNIEYIIIDGGSTDNTLDIIKKYESNIDFWVSEPDSGLYDAMNKGIKKSSGELVSILNSDDWLELHAFEEVVNYYQDFDGILYGLVRLLKNEQEFAVRRNSHYSLILGRTLHHAAVFVPKNIYNKVGFYNQVYPYAADYDFLLRAFENNVKFKPIDAILTNFRIGGMSSSKKVLLDFYKIRAKYHIGSVLRLKIKIALCEVVYFIGDMFKKIKSL